jgi:hypothetical protein
MKRLDTEVGDFLESLFAMIDNNNRGRGLVLGEHLDGTPAKTAATDDEVSR